MEFNFALEMEAASFYEKKDLVDKYTIFLHKRYSVQLNLVAVHS
jgi:hypothetical protein